MFVDDFSRFTWLYPLKRKLEVPIIFVQFQKMVENQFDWKIKIFQCDGGLEFDNTSLQEQCVPSGILFCKSCPNTQPHNDIAERKHKHILEMVRTFLIQSLPASSYWVKLLVLLFYDKPSAYPNSRQQICF